jgi:hypothetical protein
MKYTWHGPSNLSLNRVVGPASHTRWVYGSEHPSNHILVRNARHANLQLGRLGNGANLVLVAVLLEDVLGVVLPEGLGGILASESLEDAVAAGVLGEEF